MPEFSRYRTSAGIENEHQPGSHGRVLRNKLGITSKRRMDRSEYHALLRAQHVFLRSVTTGTRFTSSMLCRMHRLWLDGLYPWAGRYRTVEMAKNGFRWPPSMFIAGSMNALSTGPFRQFTPCRGSSKLANSARMEDVARKIAVVHADLLLIHPFRDGNGRLARWLSDLMAMQADYPSPRYNLTGRGSRLRKKAYIHAVQRGYVKDYEPLAAFFVDALRRALAAR
ncbi:MAG: Fic family protein [Phycisphaeraceae bacterium]|nr:Fic family protein [Phycisphaeraceae bacterium]